MAMRRRSTLSETSHCQINYKPLDEQHGTKRWPDKSKRTRKIRQECCEKFDVNDNMAASVLPAVDAYSDYHVKYHSVSGGSALSQSMKYAEAWLYGSLHIKPCLRPTFFGVECDFNADNQWCCCSPLQSTYSAKLFNQRNHISCRECINNSVSPADHNLIQGFATIRGGAALRRNLQQRFERDSCADPYDAVRRSRLNGIKSWPARAKSHSPTQRISASNACSPAVRCLPSSGPQSPVQDDGVASRKSILDCKLNAYDLIGKFVADDENAEQDSDEDEPDTSTYRATVRKKNRQTFGSKLKSKIRDSKAAKMTAQYLKAVTPKNETHPVDDVCIAGQKIRVFNSPHRNAPPTPNNDEGWTSDSSLDNVQSNVNDADAQPTPKRPPRHKGSRSSTIPSRTTTGATDDEAVYENCYQRPIRRVSGSDDAAVTAAVPVPIKSGDIKSILKKPLAMSSPQATTTGPGSQPYAFLSQTTGSVDSATTTIATSAPAITTAAAAMPATCSFTTESVPDAAGDPSENFYSKTFDERNKKTARKVKKQVQFKGMQDEQEAVEDESGPKSTAVDARSSVETGYDIGCCTRTITATTPVRSFPDRVLFVDELHRKSRDDNKSEEEDNPRSADGGEGVTTATSSSSLISSTLSRVSVKECSSAIYRTVSCVPAASNTPAIVAFDSARFENAWPRAPKSGQQRNKRAAKQAVPRIHRTLSDCTSPRPLLLNLRCKSFNDTMRLQVRANEQIKAKALFFGHREAAVNENVTRITTNGMRLPATVSSALPLTATLITLKPDAKPYLPPRQYFPFDKSKNLAVTVGNVHDTEPVVINVNDGVSASEGSDINVRIPSLTKTFLQNRTWTGDKERNAYARSVIKINVTSPSLPQRNAENRTIVTITPPPSSMSTEHPYNKSQSKPAEERNDITSLMINFDERSTSSGPPRNNTVVRVNVEDTFETLTLPNANTNEYATTGHVNVTYVARKSQTESNDDDRSDSGLFSQNGSTVTSSDSTECAKSSPIPNDSDSRDESVAASSGNSSDSSDKCSTPPRRQFRDNDADFSLHYMSCKINERLTEQDVGLGVIHENDYDETEPIYEEIEDTTPPPLPLQPPPEKVDDIGIVIPPRSIFEGASKYDILRYLAGAKERCKIPEEPQFVIEESNDGDGDFDTDANISELNSSAHSRITSLDLSSRGSHLSNVSDSSDELVNFLLSNGLPSEKVHRNSTDIERNDSGVGSETSKCSRSKWQHIQSSSPQEDPQQICEDCDDVVEPQTSDSGYTFAPLVCRKCSKRRIERREIITEIVETEEKYSRDLRIILDEFYQPMLVAGLLTPEQLSSIFLNVEELLEHSTTLAEKLRDGYEIAIEQGDEDLLTFNVGEIFLEAAPMLHAFESYCTRQGHAALLLANLEREKELLKIFLRVSQMENTVLRRMNLNSFLMVPVQRVTKYPLLLARLHKVTPEHHTAQKELLKEAQHNIELHLEHINSVTKDVGNTKIWRRISMMNGRRISGDGDDILNIKLQKIAVEVLEWGHDEVRFAMEGRLLYAQATDFNWKRTGRTIKVMPVNALLVTLGKPTENYNPECDELLMFPQKNGIREASLLLMKEKGGKYSLVREPLFLDSCVIYCDTDFEEYFEIQEIPTKDTYIFKAEDIERTKRWYRQIQYHSQGLGCWRKRRNALANIMINGMQIRS